MQAIPMLSRLDRAAHNSSMSDAQTLPDPRTASAHRFAGPAEPLLSSDGTVVQLLRHALPKAMAVYAFGSQVAGTAGTDSDLDLAVLVAGYADPLHLWDLSHRLADIAGCPVDLVDLRAASTVMQYQVLMHGKRLWAQGLEADLFECFVMGEKLALDEARAGTLADIAADGRVYGQ
jgi:predicted nucleotidyltransferase